MNNRSITLLYVTGVLLTCCIIYDLILWWIACAAPSEGFSETAELYLHFYPENWRNPTMLTVISIIAGLAAGSCFILINNVSTGFIRVTTKVFAALNFILAAWHLFSLM